jgi:dipeptidyl aminopeptidase/acylaminoacyl peptidase
LFVCLIADNDFSPYYRSICKANADGSGVVRLTTGVRDDDSPDWSPDGSQIVFVRYGQIYTMNADGSGVALVPSSPSGVGSVAWRPVLGSRRVAYTIGSNTVGAGVHTRSLDSPAADTLVVAANLGCCTRYDVRSVDWSPAGDSLVFDIVLNGLRAVMVTANAAGAVPRTVVSWVTGPAMLATWTDQGLLFSAFRGGRYRLFLLKPDGTVGLIGRDDRDNFAPGMRRQ